MVEFDEPKWDLSKFSEEQNHYIANELAENQETLYNLFEALLLKKQAYYLDSSEEPEDNSAYDDMEAENHLKRNGLW